MLRFAIDGITSFSDVPLRFASYFGFVVSGIAFVVGIVEIVAGTLIVFGLVTRFAAIALLIDIAVAIASTKIPMLAQKGFWPAMHEARTDLAMAFCLVFLVWSGGGTWSVDERLRRILRVVT